MSQRYPVAVHDEIDSAGAHVVHVFDEIDISNSRELETEVLGTDARHRLVIELSDCRYIDSSGIAVLMQAHRHFGERLRIVVASDSGVERIIRYLELHEILPLVGSLQEALTDSDAAILRSAG